MNPIIAISPFHHNVSDDFQQFIALARRACRIDNNTIIRRKMNANEWEVFNNLTQYDSKNLIRNNIVVVENDVVIFNVGMNGDARPNTNIENNLNYAADGKLLSWTRGPWKGRDSQRPVVSGLRERIIRFGFRTENNQPSSGPWSRPQLHERLCGDFNPPTHRP